jgi:hypothetical protein
MGPLSTPRREGVSLPWSAHPLYSMVTLPAASASSAFPMPGNGVPGTSGQTAQLSVQHRLPWESVCAMTRTWLSMTLRHTAIPGPGVVGSRFMVSPMCGERSAASAMRRIGRKKEVGRRSNRLPVARRRTPAAVGEMVTRGKDLRAGDGRSISSASPPGRVTPAKPASGRVRRPMAAVVTRPGVQGRITATRRFCPESHVDD